MFHAVEGACEVCVALRCRAFSLLQAPPIPVPSCRNELLWCSYTPMLEDDSYNPFIDDGAGDQDEEELQQLGGDAAS